MKILFERRLKITPLMMENRTRRELPAAVRSKGKHVQAINQRLGVAAGKLSDSGDPDYPFERFSEDCYPLMPALGVAWEELRASLYPEEELIWQPTELERDGVFGTPDGLWIPGADEWQTGTLMLAEAINAAIWECKQTTKKLQSLNDLWMYTKQGMSYCAMSGYRHVLYDVCFLLGDYTRPYTPIATTTLVEFSHEECETWWKRVLAAAPEVASE